jgi:hypothetical protein
MIFGPSCTIDGAGYRLFGNRAGATSESWESPGRAAMVWPA